MIRHMKIKIFEMLKFMENCVKYIFGLGQPLIQDFEMKFEGAYDILTRLN